MARSVLPRAPLKRILKDAGAERVAEEAVGAFAECIEDFASDLAESARRYAQHAGRKTVKRVDVRQSAR